MAKLKSERVVTVYIGEEEARFLFRQPTEKELNNFLGSRWKHGKRNKFEDRSIEARVKFFDLLLTGVEDLETAEGTPITPENKDVIPNNYKVGAIVELFETSEFEEKNS